MKKEAKPQQTESTEKSKKSFLDLFQHTWFIILSLVVAVVLVASVAIGIVMTTKGLTLGEVFGFKIKRIDYINDSLDKYISLEGDDYKDLEVDVAIREPDKMDLEDKKVELLAAAAKEAGLDKGGVYQKNEPIGAGDKIYFYYAAYIVDENGNRTQEVTGMNNCKNSYGGNLAEFVVGGSNFLFLNNTLLNESSDNLQNYKSEFIHGFQSGLIGKVPNQYKFFTVGEIQPSDIVYATVSYLDYDGLLYDRVNIRIDLSDEAHESVWGEGLYEYVIKEKSIGFENNTPITLTRAGSGKKITFTNFTVDYIVRGEETPITIKTVFPYDYSDESLRNKTVYFDLFIEQTLCYKTPEFDENFVLNTLKLGEEKLQGYEGETLVEKCESYYFKRLLDEYEHNRNILAEKLLWEEIKENADIKEVPIREVEYDYNDFVNYYQYSFELINDSAGYEDFDEYMVDVLDLEVGANWSLYIWNYMESTVIEKLIFYSVLKAEGLLENAEAFEEFCKNELEHSYYIEYNKKEEDFESDEKYAEEIAAYRSEKVYECGGESAFIDEMYYRYASAIVVGSAKINNVLK